MFFDDRGMFFLGTVYVREAVLVGSMGNNKQFVHASRPLEFALRHLVAIGHAINFNVIAGVTLNVKPGTRYACKCH